MTHAELEAEACRLFLLPDRCVSAVVTLNVGLLPQVVARYYATYSELATMEYTVYGGERRIVKDGQS